MIITLNPKQFRKELKITNSKITVSGMLQYNGKKPCRISSLLYRL